MKKQVIQFLLTLLIIFTITACKNGKKDNAIPKTEMEVKQDKINYNGIKKITLEKSSILWKGHKLFGAHTGDIKLTSGQLVFKNGQLTGGQFVADMNSIRVTELMQDDEDEDEENNGGNEEGDDDDNTDLANHLKDGDFFDTKTYPEATFIVNNIKNQNNSYNITGNITIKGKTNQIEFPAQIIDGKFKANVSIDRTKFGLKYGSGSFFSNLGDNVIKDKFDLIISLSIEE